MKKINTVLIANRGEIALRVMRTANRLGLRSIAVYSDADADALHVKMADDAVRLGPAPAGESYLHIKRVLAAAVHAGADAIHPGYGFLSENAEFAQGVTDQGMVFVGPNAPAIALMGNKAAAKRHLDATNVPCIPGYNGDDQSDDALITEADRIGYPVMVKAAAGGGGLGMRRVDAAANFLEALATARSEALNAFGSSELILEKTLVAARHVEVQIFADTHGNVVHLGERDCSVQRRNQKVLEESPCPVMTPALRQQMGAAACEVAKSIDYHGAGTVEFLLDADGAFYFLEMNTRLQVEHPVTECVTGFDLVEWQIHVAQGNALPHSQLDIDLTG
ncbi:MAG: ATP-grasp domain-containing protein, partial [Chromatiales bacterium]|nr:ATP-grasp domain-containing protein [Chromatiales bacterium]